MHHKLVTGSAHSRSDCKAPCFYKRMVPMNKLFLQTFGTDDFVWYDSSQSGRTCFAFVMMKELGYG